MMRSMFYGPANQLINPTGVAPNYLVVHPPTSQVPIGSMYAIYGNIYHQYTPNVSIYTMHGSYGVGNPPKESKRWESVVSSAAQRI